MSEDFGFVLRELLAEQRTEEDTKSSLCHRPIGREFKVGVCFLVKLRPIPNDKLLAEYIASYGALESLSVSPTVLDAIVLARDSVALTAPCDFSFKTKSGVTFSGKTVLTLLVQQRNGVWQVVQSHVSHQDVPGIMAAFQQKPPQK